MTWRLNSRLNDLCFLMTRPFLPLPGAGDPVCYSNTSVQSMGCSAESSKLKAESEKLKDHRDEAGKIMILIIKAPKSQRSFTILQP